MTDVIHTLITVPLEDELIARIRAVSERLLVTHHPTKPGEAIPDEIWAPTEVLLTYRAFPEPEQCPALRWVQYYLAGVDSLAQHPILTRDGVQATSMSGANASQTAEHALALLLALGHNLPGFLAMQGRSEWLPNRSDYHPLELRGSTVGIVGYGSIGRQLARLLRGMGATVLASKRDLMQLEDDGYQPEGQGDPEGDMFTRLYPSQALKTMFKECDFVVVTVPITEHTRGLIGAAELTALRPHACLVDVSRGGVVDADALLKALGNNQLAGAGLDVFLEEPLPADSLLWAMPNVIITPHVAGVSDHYDARAVDLFIANLQRYLDGRPLMNRVDFNRGY
ncbi:MAG: D-2-hydroxyacid dehydrogenase [Anaerolineae bacterium]|nr:MAG: D-2-hydroxyacid dehydrogenase [Anaerolineae bacterium]